MKMMNIVRLMTLKWAMTAIVTVMGVGASALAGPVPTARFIWEVRLENVLNANDAQTYLVEGLMIPDLTGEIYKEMPPPPLRSSASEYSQRSQYSQIYWETKSTFTLTFSVPNPTSPEPQTFNVRGDFAYAGGGGENLWIGWDRFPYQKSCYRFGPGYPGDIGAGAVGAWVDEDVVKALFRLPNFTPRGNNDRIGLVALNLDKRLPARFTFNKDIGTMVKSEGGPKYRVIIAGFGIDQITTPF